MKTVIAYMCHTQSSAFDLKELIEGAGGKAMKYVGECRVLSDFEIDESLAAKIIPLVARTGEPAEIEIKLFGDSDAK